MITAQETTRNRGYFKELSSMVQIVSDSEYATEQHTQEGKYELIKIDILRRELPDEGQKIQATSVLLI